MLSDLDIRFAKQMFVVLKQEQERQRMILGSGSHITDADAATAGMKCARVIGALAGLEYAIQSLTAVEREMTGKGEPRKEKTK